MGSYFGSAESSDEVVLVTTGLYRLGSMECVVELKEGHNLAVKPRPPSPGERIILFFFV